MKRSSQHNILGRLAVTILLVSCALCVEAQENNAPPSGAVSYEDLFEKAVFTEESLGDLDGAIALYRQLLDSAQEDRSFVAQAQYRLGLCYLKQGSQDEAVAVLQGLIREFPGQEPVVSEARARLAKLGVAAAQEDMSLRMIWTNAGATLGSPTADGRFLTFTDWSSGDLAIHDLKTGKDRRVTGKGSWDTPGFAEFSVPTPDGEQIAYAWYVGPDVLYDLRVINADGSNQRVVLKDDAIPWLQPIDWSSDGESIFTFLAYLSGEQLAWVDVATGAIQPLGSKRDYTGTIALSPDERYFAFDMDQSDGNRPKDIFISDLSSGEERALMEHPSDDRVVGWAPDGSHLIFVSDRTGEWGLWAVPTADGRIIGEPSLVKASMGQLWPSGQLFPMGFTRSGALYYGISDRMTDVYTADLRNGVAEAAPVKLTRRFEGTNSAPEWSSDGRYLAWISHRDGLYTVVIRDENTGEERDVDVSKNMTRIHGDGWGGIRWSSDNRFVLVAGSAKPQESWMGLFAIDVETGDIEQVAAAENNPLRVPVWAPDGKTLYYTSMDRIRSRNVESGEETVLYTGNVGNIALSPDGKEIAFTTDRYTGAQEHMLQIMPAAGGSPRVVYRSTPSEPFEPRTSLAWSPDGRYLVFGTGLSPDMDAEDVQVTLWRVPVDGGERESLGISMPHLQKARIHPDGDRIVFQAGTRKRETWVMENFIPPSVASR